MQDGGPAKGAFHTPSLVGAERATAHPVHRCFQVSPHSHRWDAASSQPSSTPSSSPTPPPPLPACHPATHTPCARVPSHPTFAGGTPPAAAPAPGAPCWAAPASPRPPSPRHLPAAAGGGPRPRAPHLKPPPPPPPPLPRRPCVQCAQLGVRGGAAALKEKEEDYQDDDDAPSIKVHHPVSATTPTQGVQAGGPLPDPARHFIVRL